MHTLDGKEYVTPAQISKEIRDELHVCGGKCGIFLLPLDLEVNFEVYRKNLTAFSTLNLSEKVNLIHLHSNSPAALLFSDLCQVFREAFQDMLFSLFLPMWNFCHKSCIKILFGGNLVF